jgi:hypothetical protein
MDPEKHGGALRKSPVERATVHNWINSIAAIGALVLSGYSITLTKNEFGLKNEHISFQAQESDRCKFKFNPTGEDGEVSVCWEVNFTNLSEDRVTITSADVYSINKMGQRALASYLNEVEDLNGVRQNFPISLDGGDFKTVLVRAVVTVNANAASKIAAYVGKAEASSNIRDDRMYLMRSRIDLVGNPIEIVTFQNRVDVWRYIHAGEYQKVELEIRTARNGVSTLDLTYPGTFARPPNDGWLGIQ